MSAETSTCRSCRQDFSIDESDRAIYARFDVKPPKMCPPCRARLRLAFRNERSFYKRKCDKCDKDVVSMYSPNKPYTVWCYDCWFADDWDPLAYGQAWEPGRPFLEQFEQVWRAVPKAALIYTRSVNSEYTNICADSKNCYMIIECSNNENCIHSYWIQQCRDLTDVSYSHQVELSYECDDCYNSYGLQYCKGCHDCRESYFLLDCRDCSNCVGCVNLRNKQYCVFNEQLSREEYEKFLAGARLDTASGVEALRAKFAEFLKNQPRKYAEIVNAPGCSGNYMKDAKNCQECFHCYDAEDCKYAEHVWRTAKDCVDVSTAGRNAARIYNSLNNGVDVSDHLCSFLGWSSTFLEYSQSCLNANHLFGCTGVRKRNHCILNKQYSKEDYKKIRGEIVAQMKTAGEWGEFFPVRFSAFGYNETAAQEQFPLTKEEALAQGFAWEDHPRGTFGKETFSWEQVPDSIQDAGSIDIKTAVFACTNCKKNYRVIPDEFSFYKRLNIPLPRLCPDCRHARRMAARGPNKLWPRQCSCAGASAANGRYKNNSEHSHSDNACPNEFETAYSPDRPEIVYCEQCYQAEVA
ncbi:MAG: hypothetical protein A2855_01990 [Candidatus Liptonbacteria bacterium RIFCSPHIGHO2_01_FULL_57_28]|uniref:Zinc-binding domain-containing protein n=1 Tax=Candidatus Liptonbacteria bacterium RIFCSPHIGHO2_01_FULL_57_28 TaxID=1798647 RepID=A0A1G2CCV0_9BACT|nr:MAG: hypothetical protein A2855_01990 [Candidatus Liptonbacteria bacterium RIFCSPHIGHO2_01_FULL_57_28]